MPDIFNSASKNKTPANPSHTKLHLSDKKIDLKKKKEKLEKMEKEKDGQLIHLPIGADVHKLPGHSHSPLASYCLYPDQVKFINKDYEEKIVLFLRKHPITNISWLIGSFFMLLVPFFVSVFPFVASMPAELQIILTLCWYLITAAYVLEKFLGWFFNVDMITDERILDINFVSLMYREITEANLDEIQEVTFKPATGIYSFFDFGDVIIQTAAEIPRLIFKSVPNPQKVAKVLRELGIEEDIEELEGRIR